MLFFLRGPHGAVVRAIVGAILLVIGIATHGALLDAIGAVMILWSGFRAISSQRVRRQARLDGGGQA
jgi:hypothetical protein